MSNMRHTPEMNIKTRFESAMTEAGLTPRELARKADISESQVYALLNGKRGKRVSFALIEKVAAVLGKDLNFFSSEMTQMRQAS
jgi:transcriptional regulator with XRE-family HTH domain